MQTWHIVLLVIFVFGIIVGNLLLLKSTANTKMPKVEKKKYDDDEEDW
ncbi:DUF2897 family protein [Alteromonadaceae bacterium M269]|nr:DUF2897 family protein [Alteromonadaceae bacterium M269]